MTGSLAGDTRAATAALPTERPYPLPAARGATIGATPDDVDRGQRGVA